ncbi:NAD-dependent epimerase/dehydratase family protein [Segetibacter sp. 3557_3]|uniref:NAD-dependent epimerase/dehydratase family protein n=1 Tax=Segetibacter sp. 3557_3 TaxID=2547429 RepID=UPI001058C1A8|nr:NAD-dependent epimerase/dehydratase family protein [Segetibacter sp. 3557_3]TDH21430.1 NAD-dependent epimerase/dehydratase family protein [Segetibacter sp. 3557_3]
MKYIVTGGAGFIGSHLCQKLVSGGKQVVAIDNLVTGNINNVDHLLAGKNFSVIEKDVRSITHWSKVISKNDVIIHLAATVGVNKVMDDPLETLENNSATTRIVLDVALKYNCKVFFASTSEVYGNTDHPFSAETDHVIIPSTHCGRAAYVVGKLTSEHYCNNYFNRYGLPVITARFFNVIGTRQSDAHGMVTPTFIKQALSGKAITIYGDGSQTRSFADVDDMVNVVLQLLDIPEAYGNVFNIGGDENITILQLAEYIKHATGSSSPIVFVPVPYQRTEGRDIHFRRPLLTKLQTMTGWKPAIHWHQTIDKIIEYQVSQQNKLMESQAAIN